MPFHSHYFCEQVGRTKPIRREAAGISCELADVAAARSERCSIRLERAQKPDGGEAGRQALRSDHARLKSRLRPAVLLSSVRFPTNVSLRRRDYPPIAPRETPWLRERLLQHD